MQGIEQLGDTTLIYLQAPSAAVPLCMKLVTNTAACLNGNSVRVRVRVRVRPAPCARRCAFVQRIRSAHHNPLTRPMKNEMQLITYVNRLSGGNLHDLQAFLTGPLKGVFGAVHLLPFFHTIDGVDAGFDPIDHTRSMRAWAIGWT